MPPIKKIVEKKVGNNVIIDIEDIRQTAEQFLISKGINPPIKSAPIQNLTFEQLCALMTEYAFI
jgi:hypothetical protein